MYVYRIERWMFTGIRSKEVLAYVVRNLDSDLIMEDSQAEAFLQLALRTGQTWAYPEVTPQAVVNALDMARVRLEAHSGEMLQRFISENDNLKNIKLTQIRNHFQRRRRSDEQRLQTARARRRAPTFLAMLEHNISRLREREADRIHQLDVQAGIRESFDEVACGIILVTNETT
jgi:hypothetical protein